ncbi:hypothetical protein CMV_000335, partial [Castanea mollissima]
LNLWLFNILIDSKIVRNYTQSHITDLCGKEKKTTSKFCTQKPESGC